MKKEEKYLVRYRTKFMSSYYEEGVIVPAKTSEEAIQILKSGLDSSFILLDIHKI